jgi:hypothetical protein
MVAILPANKHRAIWFWGSSSSPYGSANIVGNNALENQTIAFFNNKRIRRVYGSYGNRPEADNEPEVIAAWNFKLQAAGIQSQFLMAENTWIFSDNWPSFLTKVTNRVIEFNAAPGRTAAEKFDALHLDIEPQALKASDGVTAWSDLTDVGRRDYLFKLRDTFSSIDSGVSWERTNITGMSVRVGLESDVGDTWTDVPEFHDMMEQLETAYGPGGSVDIQSYRGWREALASQPLVAVSAALSPAVSLSGGTIDFPGEPGWSYVIHHSNNLCEWRIATRMRGQQGPMRCPVEFERGGRGYWKVERFRDQLGQ